MKQAHGIAAPADAGDSIIGQTAGSLKDLTASLHADDRLKIAHHHRIGMGAYDTAQKVVSGIDIGHPIADGLIDGVLEGLAAT
ncbi:hypothetical protein ES703_120500 [subsurface metagenome]